ncbi:hypothetical protein BBJ28_00022498, partial [Nothophytophthora sp. Chile5]
MVNTVRVNENVMYRTRTDFPSSSIENWAQRQQFDTVEEGESDSEVLPGDADEAEHSVEDEDMSDSAEGETEEQDSVSVVSGTEEPGVELGSDTPAERGVDSWEFWRENQDAAKTEDAENHEEEASSPEDTDQTGSCDGEEDKETSELPSDAGSEDDVQGSGEEEDASVSDDGDAASIEVGTDDQDEEETDEQRIIQEQDVLDELRSITPTPTQYTKRKMREYGPAKRGRDTEEAKKPRYDLRRESKRPKYLDEYVLWKTRAKKGDDMALHLEKMLSIKDRLALLHYTVHDIDMVDALLNSLPKVNKYEQLAQVIRFGVGGQQGPDEVRDLILVAEAQLQDEETDVFNLEQFDKDYDPGLWHYDTASSAHIVGCKEYFVTYEPFEKNPCRGFARNMMTHAEGVGVIALVTEGADGQLETLFLEHMLYVPNARWNLYSAGVSRKQGFLTTLDSDTGVYSVYREGKLQFTATLQEND